MEVERARGDVTERREWKRVQPNMCCLTWFGWCLPVCSGSIHDQTYQHKKNKTMPIQTTYKHSIVVYRQYLLEYQSSNPSIFSVIQAVHVNWYKESDFIDNCYQNLTLLKSEVAHNQVVVALGTHKTGVIEERQCKYLSKVEIEAFQWDHSAQYWGLAILLTGTGTVCKLIRSQILSTNNNHY